MGELRRGPVYATEDGDIVVLKCTGCSQLRRHDFHYFFCMRDTGKPPYWTAEPVYQLSTGPYPDAACPARKAPSHV